MGRPARRIEISDAADQQLRALEFNVHVHPKVRFRATLLRLHRAGWTVSQLAQHFDRNPQAVHNDLTRFEQQGIAGLADGQAPGKPPLVTAVIEPFLHEKLREDRFWTATLLCEAVAQQCQVTMSPRTMTAHLHRLGYTWKRARYSPAKTLDPAVQQDHAASIEMLKRGHWTANSA
ncbi:winged helix-turn-helix domain-containing protein [Deinococcus multiflagellatus]|uniref:Winged helix-turn-helix domain-containing protein n=1 Tax=Deinococcus multiflagellatus TaxID=1656887 RepID=A0ABW1ZTC1_9DEIO|nr:winged helix-turn-helix domain-containing protein [Deinococcus multiflagellatus]MBZ9716147.1 winged helix-turn-helix domain-containing protein [Deinococcus multiflagellatus]